jgi:inosine triphosphate pyrophosphatase
MTQSIHFITGNINKFNEAQKIIPRLVQLHIDLPEIQSLDGCEIIEAKLSEAKKKNSGPFVVEDTSFHMECMGGLPGPLAKWFLSSIGNQGLYEIARKYDNYRASFSAVVGYCDPHGQINFFVGKIEGMITAPRGDAGFGLDPIFIPHGHTKTFSEMTEETKNKFSHRQRAFVQLRDFLERS